MHTDYGVHDFKEISGRFWRIVDGNPTELDKQIVWAVLKVVFGKK